MGKLVFIFAFIASVCYPQVIWEKLNEPYGGTITKIFMRGDTILAASSRNFFYSTNRGNDWHEGNFKFTDFTYGRNGRFFASSWDGIFYSDNLVDWHGVHSFLENTVLTSDRNGNVYASASIYDYTVATTDNGNTWRIYYAPHAGMIRSAHCEGPYLFLVSGSAVHSKNTEKNDHWRVNTMPGVEEISGDGKGLVYAWGPGMNKIAWTNDFGTSWQFIELQYIFSDIHPSEVTWNDSTIIISSSQGDHNFSVIRSSDNGTTWERNDNGILSNVNVFRFIYSGGEFLAAVGGYGVIKSTDKGLSWNLSNKGMNILQINMIASGDDGILYAAAIPRGVIMSTDHGETWQDMNEGLTDYYVRQIISTPGGDIYTGTFENIFRWDSIIKSWVKIPPDRDLRGQLMTDGSDHIYVSTYSEVQVSSDKGKSWNVFFNGNNGSLRYLIKTKRSYLIVCHGAPGAVYRCADYGVRWEKVYEHSGYLGRPVSEGGNIFIPVGNGIAKSEDDGNTWTILEEPIPYHDDQKLYSDGNGNFYLTTAHYVNKPPQVAVSTDECETWTNITGSLRNNQVNYIHFANGRLLAAADEGLWTLRNDPGISSSEEKNVPSEFLLRQNFPNPFNPSTRIKFDLPEESIIDLNVYDVTGALVRKILRQEVLSAGKYNYNFDAEDLPSGMYIYACHSVSVSSGKETFLAGKMILLK